MRNYRLYVSYMLDALFGVSRFTPGILRPSVVRGRFNHDFGEIHAELFRALVKNGFTKTRWQLIFPGQTAGLVKRLHLEPSPNEIHVRFYNDGTIHCEREHSRFDLLHWSGTRVTDFTEIEKVIEKEFSDEAVRSEIASFFGDPEFSELCIRKKRERVTALK